jgi:MFS family permease
MIYTRRALMQRLAAIEGVVRMPEGRRGIVWALGLGAFGLAFSITIVAAYLPPLLGRFTSSPVLIAAVISAEGLFAITLPLVVGPWSDTFHTPFGRRRPFMLVALAPMSFCLTLVAFMPSFWTTALVVFAFYFAYYIYEPPYRGLYPDLLPQAIFGRAQGVQHVMRGAALGSALVGGGFLFHVWRPSPFLLAAAVTATACGAAIVFVREEGGHQRVFEGLRTYLVRSLEVVRGEPYVRRFLIANTAWETAFAAARTFVVLYFVKGLHQPLSTSSAVLGVISAGYVVAAIGSGPLGDRVGLSRVIFVASLVYGGGYMVAGLAQTWHDWYYAALFPVAVAGGTVMTLAWALLFKLMPAQHRGAVSGIAVMTKGIGLLFGPLIAGAAIDLLAPYLSATHGYQILWPICGLPILAAAPLVYSLIRVEPVGRTG